MDSKEGMNNNNQTNWYNQYLDGIINYFPDFQPDSKPNHACTREAIGQILDMELGDTIMIETKDIKKPLQVVCGYYENKLQKAKNQHVELISEARVISATRQAEISADLSEAEAVREQLTRVCLERPQDLLVSGADILTQVSPRFYTQLGILTPYLN